MPTAEQVTEERLLAFRDLARSGITELTGQAIRSEGYGAGEFVGRHKGLKSAFPRDFNRVPDSPKQIADAIDKGAGKAYDRVYAAVLKEAEREGYQRARKRSPGKPTVPPHSGRPYCVHCGVMHAKGQHRFHGKGAYHKTHLFSFGSNPGGFPMMTTAGAKRVFAALMKKARERQLTAREKEALVIARQTLRVRARPNTGQAWAPRRKFTRAEMKKAGWTKSAMDREKFLDKRDAIEAAGFEHLLGVGWQRKTGPYSYDRFQTIEEAYDSLKKRRKSKSSPRKNPAGYDWKAKGNPRRRRGEPTKAEMRKIRRRMRCGKIVTLRPRSNPGGRGTVIYGQVIEIVCRRTGPHRCDAACKRVNHTYRHVFKSKPEIRGLDDGRLMIG